MIKTFKNIIICGWALSYSPAFTSYSFRSIVRNYFFFVASHHWYTCILIAFSERWHSTLFINRVMIFSPWLFSRSFKPGFVSSLNYAFIMISYRSTWATKYTWNNGCYSTSKSCCYHVFEGESVLEVVLVSKIALFNSDLNRGCLVFIFSLHFSGSKFLINYSGNFVYVKFFCVRRIFRTQLFAGLAVFSFCD